MVLGMLLWHKEKLLDRVRELRQEERMQYLEKNQWDLYQKSYDLMLAELIKFSQQLEKDALQSIGLTSEQWVNSITKHFSYPKDLQLC